MADENYEPVVFENSLGEQISNDPVFLAQRTLEAAGLQNNRFAPFGGDEPMPGPYDDLNGKELKKLAEDREVDISGLRTVGEVRKALEADDVAKAAAATDQGSA